MECAELITVIQRESNWLYAALLFIGIAIIFSK
jgi:hypothetical protein